jgi:adenylylsulfate kinase
MSWVIWITGLPGSGKTTLARGVAEALTGRGIRARLLEFRAVYRAMVPEPHGSEVEQDIVHRALVEMAKALSAADVPVLVDATAPRRQWRDLARRAIRHFAEVQLVCPPDVCSSRERAVRWGLVAEGGGPRPAPVGAPPEIAAPYEYSLQPDLTIPTDLKTPWTAIDEVVRLALALHRLGVPPRPEEIGESSR